LIVSFTCVHTLSPPDGVFVPVLTVFFKGILKAPVPLDKGFLSFLLLARLTCGFTSVTNGSGAGTGGAGGAGGAGGGGKGGGGGGLLGLLNMHIRFHHP
tara:strand:- start:24 stop:320 length:297 start_codon:yes stop_codon:yes gene_type:complete